MHTTFFSRDLYQGIGNNSTVCSYYSVPILGIGACRKQGGEVGDCPPPPPPPPELLGLTESLDKYFGLMLNCYTCMIIVNPNHLPTPVLGAPSSIAFLQK